MKRFLMFAFVFTLAFCVPAFAADAVADSATVSMVTEAIGTIAVTLIAILGVVVTGIVGFFTAKIGVVKGLAFVKTMVGKA